MRLGRAGAAAGVALAGTLAAAGAVANLRLLEPSSPSRQSMVLGISVTDGSASTTTTLPAAADPSRPMTPGELPPSSTTTTVAPPSSGVVRTYVVGGAGSVTLVVRAGTLLVESIVPSAGWTADIEAQRADEVAIRFRRVDRGENGEAALEASLHGDDIRAEIEVEAGESPDD